MASSSAASRILVAVRKRPMNKNEVGRMDLDVIQPTPAAGVGNSLIVLEQKVKYDLTKYVDRHPFTFDMVFGDGVTTSEVR